MTQKYDEDNIEVKTISKVGIPLTGGTVEDIFTVTGGPVIITEFIFEVTETVSVDACIISLVADPIVGSVTDIATATAGLDIQGRIAGIFFKSSLDSVEVLTEGFIPTYNLDTDEIGIVIPIGGIDMVLSNSAPTTGIITAFIRYKPLDLGARITA